MKEIGEDSEDGKMSHAHESVGLTVKIAVLPNAIYTFNAIPTKTTFKLIKKNPRKAETILYNIRISRCITLPDFKLSTGIY